MPLAICATPIGNLDDVTLRVLEDDESVRAVVLAGAGPAFCAGADLNWMRRMAGYGYEDNLRDAMGLALMLQTIDRLKKPVIARVHGPAFAGGVGLVAACDIAIAPERTTFAFTEVRIGVVPAVISVPCLRRMPSRAAAEYFLTGETFDARRAVEIGLLTRAVPDDELDEQTARYTAMLLRGAPGALAGTKGVLRDVPSETFADGLARMAELSGRFFGSDEGREGMAAFVEKRKPDFKGR